MAKDRKISLKANPSAAGRGVGVNGERSVRLRIVASMLIAAVLVALAEASLALLPRLAGKNLLRGILYFPPEVTREQYERYLAIRDPVVGWPARAALRAAGGPEPRPSPAFPEAREWCVTLYGESFTYGDEVSDAEAWGNVLAQRLGCRVANFGVGGYGTDQALLRFTANPADRAPVTIVGVFADNPLRNVNQYRYFLGGEALALKPRFVLENGALKLVPIPNLSYEQFINGLSDPRAVFAHEVFLPGSRHGPVIWSFPYTLSLLDLVRTDHVINYVRGRPSWINFHRLDHDSRALPTTVAIVEEFRRRATAGKTVVAVIYPTGASYKLTRRTGESTFGALVAELAARGIPARDLTADFAAYLGERSFCEMLSSAAACSGHYNAEGNRVVAEAMQAFLAANRLPGHGKQ